MKKSIKILVSLLLAGTVVFCIAQAKKNVSRARSREAYELPWETVSYDGGLAAVMLKAGHSMEMVQAMGLTGMNMDDEGWELVGQEVSYNVEVLGEDNKTYELKSVGREEFIRSGMDDAELLPENFARRTLFAGKRYEKAASHNNVME